MTRSVASYLFANFFCLFGVWLIRLAIIWMAWDRTSSYFWLGVIAAAQLIPTLVFSPIAGSIADRVKVAKALLIILISLAAITLSIVVTDIYDISQIGVLTVQAGLIGICSAAYLPVRAAMIRRISSDDQFARVVVFDSMSFNVTRLVGPAFAGFAIAFFGVKNTLLLGLVGHVPLMGVLAAIASFEADPPDASPRKMGAGLAEAVGLAWTTPSIQLPLLVLAIHGVFVRGVMEQFPAIADGFFDRGAIGAGQLLSSAGFGAVCATLLLLLVPKEKIGRGFNGLLLLVTASCVAVPIFGIASSWTAAMMTAAFVGLSGSILGVVTQVQIQSTTPAAYQGRVMSFWTILSVGAAALGALVIGYIADQTSVSASLYAAGGCGSLLAVVIFLYKLIALKIKS